MYYTPLLTVRRQDFFYCLDLIVRRLLKTSVKLAAESAAVWDLLMEYKVILIASYF